MGGIPTTRLPAPPRRARSRLRATGTTPTSLRRRIFRGEASSGWVESCGGKQGERKKREGRRREARPVQASCAFSQSSLVCDNGLQRRESDFIGAHTVCSIGGCLFCDWVITTPKSLRRKNPAVSPGALYQFCQTRQSCTRTVLRGEPARIHLPLANFSTRSRRRKRR